MGETAKVTITAKLANAFNRTFQTASDKMEKFSSKIKRLEKAAGAAQKLEVLRRETDKAKKALQGAEKPTTALKNKLNSLAKKMGIATREAQELGIDTRNLARENVRLARSIDKVNSKQQRLNSTMKARSRIKEFGGEAASTGGAALATGIAGLAAATKLVSDPVKFESVVSEVSARSSLTGAQTTDLAGFFRDQAASSLFKSDQVGQAGLFLAKSGFGLEDTKKTLPAVLDLASAEGADLGFASDFVTDIIDQFGLSKGDAGTVVDTLAKASNIATTDIFQLREAFINFGSTASQMGISLEESSAMMGLLAKAGLKGAKGTAVLQTAMLKLADPSKEAAASLEQEGIEVFDSATGKFVGLESLLSQLQDVTDNLSQEEGTKLLTNVFGTRGASRMLAILNQRDEATGLRGVDLFNQQLAKINDAKGFARELAKARERTTTGRLGLLGSTFQETQNLLYFGDKDTPFGEGPLQVAIQNLISTVDGLLKGFNQLVEANPDLFAGIVLLVGAVSAALVAFGAVGLVLGGLAFSFLGISAAIGVISGIITGPLLAGVGILIAAFLAVDQLVKFFSGKSLVDRLLHAIFHHDENEVRASQAISLDEAQSIAPVSIAQPTEDILSGQFLQSGQVTFSSPITINTGANVDESILADKVAEAVEVKSEEFARSTFRQDRRRFGT
jgi:TP901 family phage tail tape measure protein